MRLRCLSQAFQIFEIVEIGKEDRSAIMTALDDMLRHTGNMEPGFSRHREGSLFERMAHTQAFETLETLVGRHPVTIPL